MFLSTKVLSKLMKDAYKVRLKIGYLNGGITIIGGSWASWIQYDHVPNKIKALITEFAGGLPEKGKLFSICKEYPEPQYEVVTEEIEMLFDGIEDAKNKLNATPIILDIWKPTRIFQTDNALHSIVEIQEAYVSLVDKSEINLDIEGEPTGPCYGNDPYGPVYWYNDICYLVVQPMKQRANPLFTALREVRLNEKILTEE